MKNALATIMVLAGVRGAAPAYADEPQIKFPHMGADLNYCEMTGATETQCFTRGRGSPQSHPTYVFNDSKKTVREQLPTPKIDPRSDNEYLDHVVYATDSFGNLTSVILVTERRIGDQFITKQDLPNNAYRRIDFRTGEEVSLCVFDESTGGYACGGSQIKKSQRTIRDKRTALFEKYSRRLHTIQRKASTVRQRK